MTSRTSPSECFVYITLPGEVSAVTAGRFVLTRNARGDAVGRFVYRAKYLEDHRAVEIDPVELRLSRRTFETVLLNGMFGALRDAGPDYWGRHVIERHAGKAQLGELDYLLVDAVCREPLALPLCRTGGTHAAERSGYSGALDAIIASGPPPAGP